ncbi:hypothetical protein LDENG_00292890, partial [Lucifuga dentata]
MKSIICSESRDSCGSAWIRTGVWTLRMTENILCVLYFGLELFKRLVLWKPFKQLGRSRERLLHVLIKRSSAQILPHQPA